MYEINDINETKFNQSRVFRIQQILLLSPNYYLFTCLARRSELGQYR